MITRSAISVLVLLVLAGPRLSAQVLYGSLSGTVADSTGAVVPGALSPSPSPTPAPASPSMPRPVIRATISSPASYRASTSSRSPPAVSDPFTRVNIAVTANTVRREDVTLELGQVTDSVTVQAAAVSSRRRRRTCIRNLIPGK